MRKPPMMMPGMMPPMKSCPIEVLVTLPSTTMMMLGGMMGPSAPAAAWIAVTKRGSEQRSGEADDPPRHAALVHDAARQHEEQDGHDRERVERGEHALRDHDERDAAAEEQRERGREPQPERDGHAQREEHGQPDQEDRGHAGLRSARSDSPSFSTLSSSISPAPTGTARYAYHMLMPMAGELCTAATSRILIPCTRSSSRNPETSTCTSTSRTARPRGGTA